MDFYVISVLFLCFRARLFVDALWSPADLLALVCDVKL